MVYPFDQKVGLHNITFESSETTKTFTETTFSSLYFIVFRLLYFYDDTLICMLIFR